MKKQYLYIYMLLMTFCAIGNYSKAQDVGNEDDNSGAYVIMPDGSVVSNYGVPGNGGAWVYNSDGTYAWVPQAVVVPGSPPGTTSSGTTTSGGSYVVTVNGTGIVTDPGQVSTVVFPGDAGSVTITFDNNTVYNISTDIGTCDACTEQEAMEDMPIDMPTPQLPPDPTQAEINAITQTMQLYGAAMNAYYAPCPAGHYKDSCGFCIANGQTSSCKKDCAGVWGGKAFKDSCGNCTGGNTGKVACKKDCAGVWGGTAAKDSCGNCTGGTSGKVACNKIPCQTDSTLNVTSAMLKTMSPSGTQQYFDSSAKYLNMYMKDFGINTRLRLAYFLANASEETDDYTHMTETYNYTEKNLLDLWPDLFDSANVTPYIGCLCALDRAYADDGNATQHNNGNEASKDGGTYRGRGLFHLTHRDSYYRFTQYYQNDYNTSALNFETTPDSVASNMKYAVLAALWEYGIDKSKSKTAKYNALMSADNDDLARVTALINGGTNGITIRRAKLKIAKKLLCL